MRVKVLIILIILLVLIGGFLLMISGHFPKPQFGKGPPEKAEKIIGVFVKLGNFLGPKEVSDTERKGLLLRDEIWSGEILVTGTVIVFKGVTLTIKPGTIVKFKHCRDYQGTCSKTELVVDGGILI